MVLQLAGACCACAALIWTFRDVRMHEVIALLAELGLSGVILLLVPQLAGVCLETSGWRVAFPQGTVRWTSLLRVRIATESPALCLPGGVVLAESLKVPLLVRHSTLNVPAAVCGTVARKYLLLTSQALYVAAAALCGREALERASPDLLGGAGLFGVLVGAAVLVAGAGFALRAALCRGGGAHSLRALLGCLPFARIRKSIAARAQLFGDVDRALRNCLSISRAAELRSTGLFFFAWVLESVETFVILRLLGVELGFFTVASFEVALSLLRSIVFVLPAGVGLQDAGYVLFLKALGVPDAATAGAAFSLIKRSKEALWAALGFSLLGADLVRPPLARPHAGAVIS